MNRRVLLLVLLAGAVVALTSTGGTATAGVANPLAGLTLYVDHDSPAWKAWEKYTRRGQKRKADLVWKIAREPRSIWLGAATGPNPQFEARRRIDAAKAVGAVPVFVVLRAQANRCSPTYQGGGPREDRATRNWYDALAQGIGNDRVVIGFEPDSLGTIQCLARSRRDDRYRLLRHGVDALSKLPNATIYLDAGASDWESARSTAKQLTHDRDREGARLHAQRHALRLDGGEHPARARDLPPHRRQALRRQHGGERARAGALPPPAGPARSTSGATRACADSGRRPPPRRPTRLVDAYLWINRPGFAQSCTGRRIAWYPPKALSYARFATDWEKPPRGTRFGHVKRYPRRAFGRASDWENARRTAKQLRRIGIAKVRGFMLNATHYDWTAANIRHGLEISRLTGGKHFIINTAENGRGPVHYRRWIDRSRHIWRTINIWCSPGLRGLGPSPTTDTSNPMVDAYLWINRPGFAQSCAGHPIDWYPPRAFTYARSRRAGRARREAPGSGTSSATR